MEAIWGSLKIMPVMDVMRHCLTRNLSGTLRCESGTGEKSIVIDDGRVVQAGSNDPREYLGQFLINYGHINEEQLAQAFETQQQTRVFLGRILVMIGLVEEKVLCDVLGLKVRETVLSMMTWEHGKFHFSENELPERDPSIDVRIPLTSLFEESEFRRTAWAAVRQVFPRDDLHLEVTFSEVPDKHEHPLDERIIDLAIQGQSIAEIALSLHATPFALHQRLLALYRLNVLAPLEPGQEEDEADVMLGDVLSPQADDEIEFDLDLGALAEPSAAGIDDDLMDEEQDVSELVARSRELLAKGSYDKAHETAAEALAINPLDGTAQAALKEAETGLLAELRHRLLGRPLFPVTLSTPEAVGGKPLSAAQRYLLKRFDGSQPLGAVLRVSPISEVEGLKVVEELVAEGLVRLDESQREG